MGYCVQLLILETENTRTGTNIFYADCFTFLLLGLTCNSKPRDFVRLALEHYDIPLSVVVLAGLILIIGQIICLRAMVWSIGEFRHDCYGFYMTLKCCPRTTAT